MFVFYEEEDVYRAKVNGIVFVCQDVEDDDEEYVQDLAQAYEEMLPEILDFMMEDICDIYGEIDADELVKKLGQPMIDLDMQTIAYLEHTLDDQRIIEVEFDGVLEALLCVNIEG